MDGWVRGNAVLGCVREGARCAGEDQETPEALVLVGEGEGTRTPQSCPPSLEGVNALRHRAESDLNCHQRNQPSRPCRDLKEAEARHDIGDTERLPGTPPHSTPAGPLLGGRQGRLWKQLGEQS